MDFTSISDDVILVFCSTAKKNPMNDGRGRSRLRTPLFVRSK